MSIVPMLWLAVFAITLLGLFTPQSEAQTIRRITAPGKFYVDDKDSNGVIYNYAVYTISNNTGVNIPSAYVALTNIYPTNRIQLASTDNGVRTLGALAPGETKLAAFYLRGPGFTGNSDTLLNVTNEVHTIQVWAGPPVVGSLLSSSNYSFTNIIFLIEAAANKVTVITNLNPLAILGSEVSLVIAGDTGTIGGNNSITFSPGVLGSWRPDAYQLINTVVRFSQNPTYTNRLYFDPTISGFTNYGGQTYTNTFLFRAVRVTGTNLPISPFAFVDSGSGTKHTALSSLISAGGTNQIYSASNLMSIVSHTVTPSSLLAPGGLVTYSVTFSNGFFAPLDLDEIVNTLPGFPGNMSYVPGSATYNSVAITNPSILGQTLRWGMPFTVPGNGTGTLTFQAIAPLPAGNYTNRVVGVLGNEQIDLTVNTSDNLPATSVFTIIPVSDLGLAKSGPSTTPAGGNFNYTLTVTNLGPSPASSITVTDALPAAVTFVSATSGGFLSGGKVIWTNLSVAASNSTTLALTVAAPPDGMALTNGASIAGPNLDPNSTNNVVTPLVFTGVTPVADLALTKTAPPVVPNNLNFNYTLLVTNRGPSAATNVAVTDALPSNVTFVSASNDGFLSGGNVLWTNLGTLGANTSLALTLTVTAPASGGTTNTASVTSPTSDPDGGNNSTPPVVSTVGNVAPTTVNDFASAPRNTLVSVNVLANDSDANGDPLSLISATQTNGTSSINGSNVEFLPVTNFLGTVVLTYTVTDGQGGTNAGLFTINITNRPPVALNDAADVTNGVPRQLFPLVNDTDPDGDLLTITNAIASNGSVTINPGGTNLTFTASNSFNGTVAYTVVDGFGGASSAVVAILGNNIAPTAFNSAGIVIPEDSSTNLVYNVADDGTNLTFAILDVPTNGVISAFNANAGTAIYTPNTNYFGDDSFTFTVFDGQLYATGQVSLIVTPVNDAPITTNLSFTTPEETATNLVLTASDVDNTNLVFAILTAPTNGLNVLNTNTGAVTYTPTSNYFGGDGFTFTVFDGSLYATGVVAITVTPLNDAPVAFSQSVTNVEDTTFPVTLTSADVDGPATNFVLTSLPLHGAVTGAGANLTYTPTNDYFGPDSFSFTVDDGSLTSAVATVSITVLPVNDAPVANNQVIATPEDTSTNLVLTASDVDNTNLVFAIVSGPSAGSLGSLDANTGAVSYSPNTNYVGSDSVTFTVFDGSLYATGNVSITVTPINDAPIANSQSVTNLEDAALPITLTSSDVDGPVTNFVLASLPTHGALTGSGANLTYTPTNNYFGPDSFSFTVDDGSLTSAVATVSITVLPVNDAPDSNDDAYSTPKNVVLNISAPGILANDADVENNALTAVLVANVTQGTLSLNTNGGFIYTPSNNYVGPDSFTYVASDGISNSAVATVNLNITVTNLSPIAVNDSITMTEDGTNSIPVLVNDTDPDGDLLTVASVVATNGFATLVGTNVVYIPEPNFAGTNELTYCISDGAITNCALITVIVQPVNDAPVANNQSITVPEDLSTNVVLTASDLDSTNLTFAIVNGPVNGLLGTLNTNSGLVDFMPNTNFVGGDSFTFAVFDGSLYATGTVNIAVTPVNDAPVAFSQSVTNLEDTPLPLTLTGSDVDGPVTNFVLVSLPSHGALSGSGANILYTPTNDYFGPDSFAFTVNDGSLTSALATVNITVLPLNDAPVANNQAVITPEDTATNLVFSASDVDSANLTFALIGGPANGTLGTLNTNSGAVSYSPNTNYVGADSITFTVFDGSLYATGAVSITVTPINDLPIANSQSVTNLEDTPLPITLTGTDVDGPVTNFVLVSLPSHGALSGSGANLLYTPTNDYFGPDSFTFAVNDGSLTSTVATVSITVLAANDAPIVVNDTATVLEDSTNSIPVLTNDSDLDGDPLMLISVLTTNGTATVVGTNVVYTPSTNFHGTNVLTYSVTDGTVTNNALITVVVTPVNDAPVLTNDAITVSEDSTNNIPVLANDGDVDGDVLTLVGVTTTNGTATIVGTNVVYTPALNFHGTNTLAYQATDGTVTNSATITVIVTPVNDAPLLVNDFMLVYDQSTNTIPVLANDSDLDGDLLALISVSTTNGVASVVSSNVVYSPAPGVIGTNVLTYFATDGTVTNGATITVVVQNVPIAFGSRRGTNVFNPQTGLYEQVVVVTNLTSTTVAAVRLLVGDFASTNGTPRTNVWLWNASGTNFDGRRFVQYNAPLNPGQFASMLLEFYNPTRLPFTNSLEAQAVLPTPATTNLASGVAIDRAFVDNRESGNPRFVIEWVSIPGRSYTVIYSDDNMLTWRAATPSVTAGATRTQWYDDGPPKTATKPIAVSSRLYRVILNP